MKVVFIVEKEEYENDKKWVKEFFVDDGYKEEDVTDKMIQNHLLDCWMEDDPGIIFDNAEFVIE
jgi:hypothetical protein